MPVDFAVTSTCHASHPLLHVAIIPDANGRWAEARGLPRAAGHARGADVVREVVRAAPGLGIGTLTLHAFSADNWRRPPAEAASVLGFVERFLRDEAETAAREGLRVVVLGRRDRLPPSLVTAIDDAERFTRGGDRMTLRLAVDYSARDAIAAAALRLRHRSTIDRNLFAAALACDRSGDGAPPAPDVDLLVRTGGEQRLSDFLVWECAYAELLFVRTPWPEFGPDGLAAAVRAYRRRRRTFGALPDGVRAAATPRSVPRTAPRACARRG